MSENTEVSSEATSVQETPTSWLDSVDADLRGESCLTDIKDVNSLTKSYVHSQRKIGELSTGNLKIPTEHASDEAKTEFYDKLKEIPGVTMLPDESDEEAVKAFRTKLGVPADANNYEIKGPENFEMDAGLVEEFKGIAHTLGLTNKQANELANFAASNDMKLAQEMKGKQEAGINTLKSEWGNDFDNRLQGAEAMLSSYEDKYTDAVNEIRGTGLRHNPVLINLLSDMYQNVKGTDVNLPNQSIEYGMTATEAKRQLNDIEGNLNHPFYSAPEGSVELENAQKEVMQLRQASTAGQEKRR